MMKKIRLTYTFLLAAALSMLTACSSDDAAQGGGEKETTTLEEGLSEVRIHLSVAAPSGPSMQMRAYSDDAAVTEEMMNLWTVVAVNSSTHKVAFIHAAKPATAEREIDDLVKLENGTYDFYSFANIPPSVVCQLLGIGGYGKGGQVMRDGNDGGNDPTSGNGNEDGGEQGDPITRYDASNDPFMSETGTTVDNNVYNITFTEGEDVTGAENIEVGIDGNGFDITATNVFGATGIPMSNVQTGVIIDGTTDVNLIVVRMFAKVEVRLFNTTGSDITVKSATLSDVTLNYNNNIKLLPKITSYEDDMAAHHMDIQPKLGTSYWTGDYTKTPASAVVVPANTEYSTSSTAYKTISFFINESTIPTNSYGHFFLTLEIDKGGGTSEYRYALIEEDATPNEWNYIARNDYRIIPVVLDDYVLDIIPYDFPAIGVYPASVKEEDGLYTINFHDYGHFHLQPVVKKMSTGDAINYWDGTGSTPATDYWTLDTDWATSWKTYDKYGGTASANPGDFYRNETATADADEAGGVPVWYVNDGVAGPQWDPAGGSTPNYQPFIFGYIADPGGALPEDKKVYHEFTIQLHKAGGAPRQMTYRLYMILDKDQMLYSRMFGAPRVRHTHGY